MQQRSNRAAAQHDEIAQEVDTGQRHEQCGHHLHPDRVEMPKAGVVRRKTAQPHGGTHVHEGVDPAHASPPVGQQAGDGKAEVHAPQATRGLGDARGELGVFHRARCLGLVDLEAAQTHHRQHRHHQQHDAQTAQILQKAAPDVDRRGQCIEPAQRGGAGGGEPAHGLEVGFEPADVGHGVHQRQRRIGRQDQPHQVHQQEAVARLQFAALVAGAGHEQQAADQGQCKAGGPHQGVFVGVERQRPAQGHKKGR